MSKILIAAEYAHGHIEQTKIAMLADHFNNEGHDVYVMLGSNKGPGDPAQLYISTMSDAKAIYGFTHDLRGYISRDPVNFSELLLTKGYSNYKKIATNLKMTVNRLRRLQPDYVLAYESPTAALATRISGVDAKLINLGDHRFIPPTVSPYPSFGDALVPEEQLALADSMLLSNVQKAVSVNYHIKIDNLGVFFTDDDLIEGWSYLDPFGRDGCNYVGNINPYRHYAPMQWQSSDSEKRILCHLDSDHTDVVGSIGMALRDIQAEKIVNLYGENVNSFNYLSRHACTNYTIRNRPLNYDGLLCRTDLLICHYNRDLIMAATNKGIPIMVINRNPMEERLTQYTKAKQWVHTTDTQVGIHGWRMNIESQLDQPANVALQAISRHMQYEIPSSPAVRILSRLIHH